MFYYDGKVRLSEDGGCAAQVLVQRAHTMSWCSAQDYWVLVRY